ncbi:MAG: NAD(P)H-dependent oxidoreductase [Methylococcus sp.]|nr:NAD(P)H-dependent oxidoreductase [Methylococcus sp.]
MSGSLRKASINSALLRAAARLAPPELAVTVYSGLGDLPLFNLDLEAGLPADVVRFHSNVAAADALLIASPEYAHGVTGTIKNALDWLVGFEGFAGIQVAVLNASPRAHHADDALRETLRTMAAAVVEEASVNLPLLGSHLDENGMIESAEIAGTIGDALATLDAAVLTLPPRRNTVYPGDINQRAEDG